MELCKYKHIFGEEGKGIHGIRVANIAVVDLLLTIVFGYVLHIVFSWNLWLTLSGLFVLAIVVHRLFCVNTTINMLIFGKI